MTSIEYNMDEDFELTSIYINLIKNKEKDYFKLTSKQITKNPRKSLSITLDFVRPILDIFNSAKQSFLLSGVEITSQSLDIEFIIHQVEPHVTKEELVKISRSLKLLVE